MNDYFKSVIKKATGASELVDLGVIQSLWSGYGKIIRFGLKGSSLKTVVVKHVRYPKQDNHPRGWNTDLSHERKLKSYQVETAWYRQWSSQCDDSCRIPKCLALETQGDEVLIVMEDIDEAGYPVRKNSVNMNDMKLCLTWLANFHAIFINKSPENLWKIGTYWHLDTRPEELEVLDDIALKNAASVIDKRLNDSKYLSFVHGDAKLANFCFSKDGSMVSAVDFQYVGGGCGMKDVAYFIGSCMYDDECDKYEVDLLNIYFEELKVGLKKYQPELDVEDVVAEWRSLYPVAWTDFHRFIKGWSPGHWKIHSYSERIARDVVKQLKKTAG